MPNLANRAVVVSLHDVSPRTRESCARILDELAELGVRQTSLLVVPDHHRCGRSVDDPAFCAWLVEKSKEGHEIVTHGYYHQRARRTGETAMQKMTTRVYTADEGEFHDLDRAAARERVERGNAELRAAGLDPRGFIAPAWLLGREAKEALRELGVEYTTTLGAVLDLKTGRTWKSQSLVWSVRAAWRRAASRVWNLMLFNCLRANPLLRISIHPVDVEHPAIWRQIRDLASRALGDRVPVTYLGWMAGERGAAESSSSSSSSSSSMLRMVEQKEED